MGHYTLFLDESFVRNEETGVSAFCVAGVAIPENVYSSVESDLNRMKASLFGKTDITLHEVEVRKTNARRKGRVKRKEYKCFEKNKSVRELYDGLSDIISKNDLKVFGATFDSKAIQEYYNSGTAIDSYSIALQIIMENFTHFLKTNDSTGNIVLESRVDSGHGDTAQDLLIKSKFYYVKAMGTMFIPALEIQNRIGEIDFLPKSKNNVGLQIADFVPNGFARTQVGLKKHPINMKKTLDTQRYGGNKKMPHRFGVKRIP